MDPERWDKVVRLYETAIGKGPEERIAFLADECGEDGELLREVQSLLDQEVSLDGPIESAARAASDWASRLASPAAIGPFRILGVIGQGGMAVVYQAQQEQPRRPVALKVLKPGLLVPEMVRRFEQECEALGRLQHPGIAQIYQAGVSAGQPYLAMELIQGLPLDEYAGAHQLSVSDRVALMAKVCDAAHHAHQRGIVHRDLKPRNILVDKTGQPKILDFGVARLSDADAVATRATSTGCLIGTLAYMSPEQVAAETTSLDARSDVYSLGVVLYELLAGRQPYATPQNLPAAIAVIREKDPLPLGAVNRDLRGDLETIAAKALEKDKERRYASAYELSEDLRCHLLHEPILARPATASYRIRKFTMRHKALVASLATVIVVLASGVSIATWQAARARRAERTANVVRQFLEQDVLEQADPERQAVANRANPNLTMREALDNAAAGIPKRFASDPEVEASVRQTVGNAYRQLGAYAQAAPHLERSLELQMRLFGPSDDRTLDALHDLAQLYLVAGDGARAESLLTRLIGLREKKLGPNHPDTINPMTDLATVSSGRRDFPRAIDLFQRVLAFQRRTLGADHKETLATSNNLALAFVGQGRYAEAVDLYKEGLTIKSRTLGPEHPDTLTTMNNLGAAYRRMGIYAESEALQRKAYEIRLRTLGPEHPGTLGSMNTLALLFDAQGRWTEAEKWIVPAAEASERLRPDHPDTMTILDTRGLVYWKLGKLEAAEASMRRSIEGRTRIFGADFPSNGLGLAYLGEVLIQRKRFADAETALRESIRIFEKASIKDYRPVYSRALLGVALGGLGRLAEADGLLTSAQADMQKVKDSLPLHRRDLPQLLTRWQAELKR